MHQAHRCLLLLLHWLTLRCRRGLLLLQRLLLSLLLLPLLLLLGLGL